MILRSKERNPLPSPSLFLKKKIETTAAGITSIAAACGVNGKQLTSQYKAFISQYREWDRLDHASEYVLFKQNIGPSLCIDETSLSCGELYTVVTNRAGRGGRGTLVAMIRGTKSEEVIKALEMIHVSKRKRVKEVTLDLSPAMMRIVRTAFPNATMTNDRFHDRNSFMRQLMNLGLLIAGWHGIWRTMKFSGAESKIYSMFRFDMPMVIPVSSCWQGLNMYLSSIIVNGLNPKEYVRKSYSHIIRN